MQVTIRYKPILDTVEAPYYWTLAMEAEGTQEEIEAYANILSNITRLVIQPQETTK